MIVFNVLKEMSRQAWNGMEGMEMACAKSEWEKWVWENIETTFEQVGSSIEMNGIVRDAKNGDRLKPNHSPSCPRPFPSSCWIHHNHFAAQIISSGVQAVGGLVSTSSWAAIISKSKETFFKMMIFVNGKETFFDCFTWWTLHSLLPSFFCFLFLA